MKKIIVLIIAAMASIMVANAQIGIIGGITSSTSTVNTEDFMKNLEGIEQYHAGIAFKLPLPLGFAIQPEILYQVKGAELSGMINSEGEEGSTVTAEDFETKDGFAELGIGVQWGIDLVAFRPFVFAKPFAGIRVASFTNGNVVKDGTDKTIENAKNDLEYGLSIGAGLELLEHFQLSFEFYKNLGNLFNEGEVNVDTEAATKDFSNIESYNGFKVSLGFFF